MKLISVFYLACVAFISANASAVTGGSGPVDTVVADEQAQPSLHEIMQEMISHQKDMSIAQREQVAMYISSLEGRIARLEGDANGSPKRVWLEYFSFGVFCFIAYQIYQIKLLNVVDYNALDIHRITSWIGDIEHGRVNRK